ncbi:TPA: hypothetical protein RQK66_000647 [Vibrio vulnificus]|nr:hypothetical protein [Vibrio vulnificus]
MSKAIDDGELEFRKDPQEVANYASFVLDKKGTLLQSMDNAASINNTIIKELALILPPENIPVIIEDA